jgi:hypothetical protein
MKRSQCAAGVDAASDQGDGGLCADAWFGSGEGVDDGGGSTVDATGDGGHGRAEGGRDHDRFRHGSPVLVRSGRLRDYGEYAE